MTTEKRSTSTGRVRNGGRRRLCALATPFLSSLPRAAAGRVLHEAQEVSRAEELLQPCSRYRLIHLADRQDEIFSLEGRGLRLPRFAAMEGGVDAVAAGVCTIGDRLEQRVSELFADRRPVLALALDRLGTEALFRLSDVTLTAIRNAARLEGLFASEQENPGDEGLSLDQQADVLALADGQSCGVSLTPGGMLAPRKSLSFVVALGRGLQEQRLFWRCRVCPYREQCPLR